MTITIADYARILADGYLEFAAPGDPIPSPEALDTAWVEEELGRPLTADESSELAAAFAAHYAAG